MKTPQNNHPYHLVDISPWPITGAMGAMTLTSGMLKWFHSTNSDLFMLGMMIIIMTMMQWWRDITREATFTGAHTSMVYNGMRWGMILFIISEVLFFFSFFWAFFNSSLAPNMELGFNWPPKGVEPFNPLHIPLLNTIILLASGVTVTWTHHAMMKSNHSQAQKALIMTILLGVYFTMTQSYEYLEAPFTLSDSIYGTTFFVTTGFHGIHVIIGTIFLSTSMTRLYYMHFNSKHHFGFEAAAWYWHFVDVVWLFLYISIYWWGY
nr:cytochrome c oxidase subunit 3 [Tripetaloceroides tonkinensis]